MEKTAENGKEAKRLIRLKEEQEDGKKKGEDQEQLDYKKKKKTARTAINYLLRCFILLILKT